MRGKAVLQALIALLLGACLVVVVAADAGAADAHDGAGETGTIGDKFGSGLGPASNPISEAGIRAIELSLMESALNGDLMGGFRKMLQSFSVLHDLWADTEIFGAMLEGLPMLRALKGVDAIAAKDRITVEDVSYKSHPGARRQGFWRSLALALIDLGSILWRAHPRVGGAPSSFETFCSRPWT